MKAALHFHPHKTQPVLDRSALEKFLTVFGNVRDFVGFLIRLGVAP